MFAYRVMNHEDIICLETTSYTEAKNLAESMDYARLQVRMRNFGGPAYNGSNFGRLRWVREEVYGSLGVFP